MQSLKHLVDDPLNIKKKSKKISQHFTGDLNSHTT